MISGFGPSSNEGSHHYFTKKHGLALPMPFNIPRVLHNLLFEDTGIEFDAKQMDLLEALRFSYIALGKLHENFLNQKAQINANILKEPDNEVLKQELEDLLLDKQQANYDFKSLVGVMVDVLDAQQIEALLRFSKVLR